MTTPDLDPAEAAARVIALRSMLPLGPGARDIADHIVAALEPLIRKQIAADILRAGRADVAQYRHAAKIAENGL